MNERKTSLANNSCRVTVGILALDSAKTLGHVIAGINAQIGADGRWEVVFIDHGSTDGTLELIQSSTTKLRSRGIEASLVKRPGCSVADSRQWLLDHATTQWIGFIDSDVVIPPYWMSRALSHMDSKSVAGVGGPLILRPLAESLACLEAMQKHVFGHFFVEQMQSELSTARNVRHLPTAAVLFDRDSLRRYGGFDRRFSMCGEDLELGERMTLAGERFVSHHELQTTHLLSCTTPRDWLERAFRFGRARIRVARKHPQMFLRYQITLPILFCLLVLFSVTLAFFGKPMPLFILLVGHPFAVLIAYSRLGRQSVGVAALAWGTHVTYALGEFFELIFSSGQRV